MQYLEGMLAPEQALEVENHLGSCAECRWLLSLGAGDSDDGASMAPTRLIDRPSPTAQSEPATRVGELLQETYLVERFIGRGGMGTVYEASHQRLHRKFAIKFLTEASTADKQAVARLRQEAEVTSRLAHPNIVEVTDFNYTADGAPFIVMELLEGEPLAQRLHSRGAINDLAEVAAIVAQTTSALQATHLEGIVHRDLKPNNIFLTRDAADRLRVKVMDFGISKILGVHTSLTGDIAVMGSPRYMAPEQARGLSSDVDQRADIFALGVIIFEMLCGTPPFVGASVPETLYKLVYDPPTETPQWQAVAPQLQRVVLQALDKQPAKRPASMTNLWQAFATALEQAGQDAALSNTATDVSATSLVGSAPVRRMMRSVGRSKALVVVGLCAIFATFFGIWHFSGQKSSPPPPKRTDSQPADATPHNGAADSRAPAAKRDSRPPDVVKKTKRRRPRRRYGRLTIQSKDADDGQYVWANVFIDGKLRGRTALTLDRISAGAHRVEVRRAGYRSAKRRIRVYPGRSTRVRFKLKKR